MKKQVRNSYYKQILATLLIVSLLPVFFLGFSIYSLVERQTETIYTSLHKSIENQKNELETIFKYVDVAMIRLGLKSLCQNSIYKDRTAANFQIFNSLQNELQLICNSEEFVDNIYLISAEKDWILGNTSLGTLSNHKDKSMFSELLDREQSSFWYWNASDLYICKRIPVNTIQGKGMLTARFRIQDILDFIAGEDAASSTFLLDKDGKVIVGSARDQKVWEYVASDPENYEQFLKNGILKTTFHHEKYVLMSSMSDYNGWNYVLVTTTSEISKGMSQVLVMLLLVVLALTATDLFFIILCSRRLYVPIGEINAVVEKGMRGNQDAPEDILSNSGLINSIKYLVHKNMEMNKQISDSEANRKQLFLRKIYEGELTQPDEKLFRQNGIGFLTKENSTFFVMAIKYRNQFKEEKDRHLYMFVLDNVICELLGTQNIFPPVTIGSVMYITYMVQSDSGEGAIMKIQTTATMIINTIQKYVNMTINIGISRGFQNIGNVAGSAAESSKALQDALGSQGECNFYQSHHTVSEGSGGGNVKKIRIRLLHAIDLGEQELCRKELEDYIHSLSALYYYMFKLEICKLVSEILSIYGEYGIAPDYERVGEIIDFDLAGTVNTYEKLQSYLWDYLLQPLFETICEKALQKDVIYRIVEYLNDHIEEDINLEECARHFNYNPNYLSRLFKKKFGKTYTDFVTEKRMERCKELLMTSNISINDLAARFGYSSPQNFIRVFKKCTLLTPGQFRKNTHNQEGKDDR